MKFKVIITIDYEIHGNGDGCPNELMVKPIDRVIRLFDEFGAKVTIMADVAEILKFKEYKTLYSVDKYSYEKIIEQLKQSISSGHDVQLHIHSGYFNSDMSLYLHSLNDIREHSYSHKLGRFLSTDRRLDFPRFRQETLIQ